MKTFEKREPTFGSSSGETNPLPNTNYQVKSKKRIFFRANKHPIINYWLTFIFLTLIGISLLETEFMLYASSGAGSIFSAFPVLRPDILLAMIIIASVTGIFYFLLSGFKPIICLFTAWIVYLFSTAMFTHFSDFELGNVIGSHSSTYISGLIAVAVFIVLFFFGKKTHFLLATMSVGAFIFVFMHQGKPLEEFEVENLVSNSSDNTGQSKYINIMIPSLPSYGYISGLTDMEANKIYRDQLRSIMLGFHAQYGFKLFPNAYVADPSPTVNASNSLNLNVPDDRYSNITSQPAQSKHWQFKKRNSFIATLKNSQLFDTLKSKGYNINAYQSQGLKLCDRGQNNNVSRCVTRIVNPINITNVNYTPFDKAIIIISQWIESANWFNYSAEFIYNRLSKFFNADKIPVIGTSYKGLYVINSLNTLDIALNDIKNDKGNQAYFIILDLPADTYVYDDMCKLKSPDEWNVKYHQPWVKNNRLTEKRSAYFRQTMCLYGKLSQFMHKLQESGILNHSTVIIQGISSMDDMIGTKDIALYTSFLNGQTTNVAISTPDNHTFTINKSICAAPDIVKQTITQQKCIDFDGDTSSKTTKRTIKDKLDAVVYDNDVAQASYQIYTEWFKTWKKNNPENVAPDSIEASRPITLNENEPIVHKQPKMMPLEEKTINKNKVMSGQIKDTPEAKVESLSEMSREPIEEVGGENL